MGEILWRVVRCGGCCRAVVCVRDGEDRRRFEPAVDIDGLKKYWGVFPSLKTELLTAISEKYYSLNVEHEDIRQTIYKNAEFSDYGEKLDEAFSTWKAKEYSALSTLNEDVSARELIVSLAEDILAEFEHLTLIDKYDVYQVLLAYWNEVMNDDVSLIISEPDGYANARETDDIEEEVTQGKNKGEMKTVGWEGRIKKCIWGGWKSRW